MHALLHRASRLYVSDAAFCAAVLLALGLLGSTASLWLTGPVPL